MPAHAWSRRACLLGVAVCVLHPLTTLARGAPSLAELTSGWRNLGTHDFRYFGLSIYQARLQAAAGFEAQRFAQHPLALGLTYARAFSGEAVAQRTVNEMRDLAQRSGQALSEAQAAQWLSQLRALFPDVEKGDRITGVNLPERGTVLFLNDRHLGSIDGAAFAQLFFGIWLSPLSPEPRMRQALIAP